MAHIPEGFQVKDVITLNVPSLDEERHLVELAKNLTGSRRFIYGGDVVTKVIAVANQKVVLVKPQPVLILQRHLLQ